MSLMMNCYQQLYFQHAINVQFTQKSVVLLNWITTMFLVIGSIFVLTHQANGKSTLPQTGGRASTA